MTLFILSILCLLSWLTAFLCFKILKSNTKLKSVKNGYKITITGSLLGFLIIFIVLFKSLLLLEDDFITKYEKDINEERNKPLFRYSSTDPKHIYQGDIGLSYVIPPDYSEAFSQKIYHRNFQNTKMDTVGNLFLINYKYDPKFFASYNNIDKIEQAFNNIHNLTADIFNNLPVSIDTSKSANYRELKEFKDKGYNGRLYWFKKEFVIDENTHLLSLILVNFERKIRVTVNFMLYRGIGRDVVDVFLASVFIE